jgi:hypothetical protein
MLSQTTSLDVAAQQSDGFSSVITNRNPALPEYPPDIHA